MAPETGMARSVVLCQDHRLKATGGCLRMGQPRGVVRGFQRGIEPSPPSV